MVLVFTDKLDEQLLSRSELKFCYLLKSKLGDFQKISPPYSGISNKLSENKQKMFEQLLFAISRGGRTCNANGKINCGRP